MMKKSNEERMSRKKAVICLVMAIVILLVSQILSSIPALLLQMAGIPSIIGIVLNGILYISLTLVFVKLFFGKVMHLDVGTRHFKILNQAQMAADRLFTSDGGDVGISLSSPRRVRIIRHEQR